VDVSAYLQPLVAVVLNINWTRVEDAAFMTLARLPLPPFLWESSDAQVAAVAPKAFGWEMWG